jgi:transcriptional regulator with GAF, ATPase, and Fis domain
MTMDSPDSLNQDGLATRLDELSERLQRVESERVDAAYARRLHAAVTRLAVLGELAAPVRQNELLQLLVGTAAQVLSAQAASLLLLDRATDELVFEVALGAAASEAVKFRVPVGQGIAGWVAASGQPVARSDLAEDTRFSTDMAERIGYVPKTVLALPLRLDDDVVGVIELFDKANGQPFTADDMELLDQFAQAAAVAIEQSQVMSDLTRLFGLVLQRMLGEDPGGAALRADAAVVVDHAVQSDRYRDAVRMALLLGEIAGHGAPAREHCLQMLSSFATYLGEQDRRNNLEGWLS